MCHLHAGFQTQHTPRLQPTTTSPSHRPPHAPTLPPSTPPSIELASDGVLGLNCCVRAIFYCAAYVDTETIYGAPLHEHAEATIIALTPL